MIHHFCLWYWKGDCNNKLGGGLLKKELRYTIKSISLKDLIIYLFGSILLSFLHGFTYYQDRWAGGVGASLYAINSSSSVFALGVPFVLGASILLRSSQSINLEMGQSKNLHARSLAISRYAVLLLISSIFVCSWIFYSYAQVMQIYFNLPSNLILQYLPGTLISGLIMTAVLCAVCMFIATILIDWRFGTFSGLAFFFIIGIAFGSSPYLDAYDKLAIFSPYHLYRFLAFGLSGHISDPVMGTIWGNPAAMNMILGINFDFTDILVSLGVWITCGLILMFLTQYLVRENVIYSALETQLDVLESSDSGILLQLKEAKDALKNRRIILFTALVLMLILLPLLYSSVEMLQREENTDILYQSSPDGISLSLGDWIYGEVEISSPPAGLNNMYGMSVEILDWDGCPEELELWSILEPIDISSFEAMNTTERDNLVHSKSLSITPDRTEIGGGYTSVQSTGPHLWAFKFVPADGYPLEGTLRIVITITLRAD